MQSVALDQATGTEIENDGIPDLVLKENWFGAKGAGEILVMALSPSPRVVISLYEEEWGLDQFERDADGKVTLWESGTADDFALAYDWPNAERPSFLRIYRVSGGKLTDVTPEHCGEIDKSSHFQNLQRALTPETSQRLKDADDLQDFEIEEIAQRVASLIFQDIACRRFDQALIRVRQMWPDRDRRNLIKRLQGIIKGWECAECKTLADWR